MKLPEELQHLVDTHPDVRMWLTTRHNDYRACTALAIQQSLPPMVIAIPADVDLTELEVAFHVVYGEVNVG